MLPTYPAREASLDFRFVRTALDRRADLREDAARTDLAAAAAARFLIFLADRPLVRATGDGTGETALFDRSEAIAAGADLDAAVFLGLADAAPWFAVVVPDGEAGTVPLDGTRAADLRALAIAGSLEPTEYGAIAEARALLLWHASHRFCARCGSPSRPASAGWRRLCSGCGAEHFPRTDPVVIMVVEDGERCLIGRTPNFPPGMYSCLAGFVEPGETVEAAVRRETREEAGITVGRVAYFASEPWPFPMSLMIGVRAEALTRDIRRADGELEDCRWIDRAELRRLLDGHHEAEVFGPPPIAIAHHLLRAFAAG